LFSVARTAIGKAYRGRFQRYRSAGAGRPRDTEAVQRAGVDPKDVDDVNPRRCGAAGTQGYNIGRLCGYIRRAAAHGVRHEP